MRVELVVAVAALAGCGGGASTEPERDIVQTLAAVHLAEARADLVNGDVDSARAAALASHDATPADLDRWLDGAARDPAAGAALWDAVAAALDSARTTGGR